MTIQKKKNYIAYAGTHQDTCYYCKDCGKLILCTEYEDAKNWEIEDINFCQKCGTKLDWNRIEALKNAFVM